MKITALYVGSSLLAPLKNAEREINRDYKLDLSIAAYNFGAPLSDGEWNRAERDLSNTDIVLVIHVMDGENASRLILALERYRNRHHAVVVINCMPELMRRTRMGKLDIGRLIGRPDKGRSDASREQDWGKERHVDAVTLRRIKDENIGSEQGLHLLRTVGSWVGRQARGRVSKPGNRDHGNYLKLIDRLPAILRFVPTMGTLRDVKHYLYLFCYFLQPTPANIRSMILYALKHYVPDQRLRKIKLQIPRPEHLPSVAIYHPDAPALFESFDRYRKWYTSGRAKAKGKTPKSERFPLDPDTTIGLLLMRPQVVSRTTKHYDALIRAIENEGLSVIPAIATLMDNRQACERFFVAENKFKAQRSKSNGGYKEVGQGAKGKSRVSQVVSLTGFSFVGGPAMNDAKAAAEFLCDLNRPYRSAVSLDTQTIEAWHDSQTGLNPMQAGMQIAIPEIDGATEPFVYGGIPATDVEPVPLEDRCRRLARRLKRWNHLRTAARKEIKIALVLFCFPPNKGNIGTAADLSVFESLWEIIKTLKAENYTVELPASPDLLRERLLGGNSESFGSTANVVYRMGVDEYLRLCPFVTEVEAEWGRAPGRINSWGEELLIQGLTLGNVFLGVQPTFGYEGDPMRLMMARGGAPHHGFTAFYTYLSKVHQTDVVVHVGTHGAMEFMPGKQIGLSDECWPDRLIGELPNIYIYSVNNPSEGSIAKRRSYAELLSYLTPPIENAGLYKELKSFKELLLAYRHAGDEQERARLFESIDEDSRRLNFAVARAYENSSSIQNRER